MELRVVLIEDDSRYRGSLENLFSLSPGFFLAAGFGNGEAAVDAAKRELDLGRTPPWDVIVMDLDLPRMGGVEATAQLKRLLPDIPVVVLTVFEDQDLVFQAISAGADGYLLKRTEAPLILKQLVEVSRGGSPLTASVARKVLSMLRESAAAPKELNSTAARMGLSDRQQDVLRALVDGCTYKDIAARLDMSLDTVRTHIRAIYGKLQVTSSKEAISKAIRKRLV